MPDHLHLLVAPPESVSLVEFVRLFKQVSAFRLKQLAGKPVAVWQQRFYDRALRSEDALEEVANYIWNNPVRAAIVPDADAYAYSGSFELETTQSGSEDTRPTMATRFAQRDQKEERPKWTSDLDEEREILRNFAGAFWRRSAPESLRKVEQSPGFKVENWR